MNTFLCQSEALPSRINVVGVSGSGKSTFSKNLAAILDAPYVEMDRLFWGPNWYQPDDEEFFAKLRDAVAQPSWVLDGNYTRSVPIKWERVDLVIWIDCPFWTNLWQAIKRAGGRAWTGKELWPGTGNRETFQKSFFSKQSIIWWTITTRRSVRQKYERYLTSPEFAKIRFLRLRGRKEVAAFLQQVQELRLRSSQ